MGAALNHTVDWRARRFDFLYNNSGRPVVCWELPSTTRSTGAQDAPNCFCTLANRNARWSVGICPQPHCRLARKTFRFASSAVNCFRPRTFGKIGEGRETETPGGLLGAALNHTVDWRARRSDWRPPFFTCVTKHVLITTSGAHVISQFQDNAARIKHSTQFRERT